MKIRVIKNRIVEEKDCSELCKNVSSCEHYCIGFEPKDENLIQSYVKMSQAVSIIA